MLAWLAVKRVDLFNDSMEVGSAGVNHDNACSHSMMTTKRVYSYWFPEKTPKFKKIYSACNFLTRTLCTVYALAVAATDRQTVHVPYVLQLVQAPTDEYHTRAVFAVAGACSD